MESGERRRERREEKREEKREESGEDAEEEGRRKQKEKHAVKPIGPSNRKDIEEERFSAKQRLRKKRWR